MPQLNPLCLSFAPVSSAHISTVFRHRSGSRVLLSFSLLFLCIFFSLSTSCLRYGLHTCTQYSKLGLTNDLYNSSIIPFSLLIIVLLIIPSTLFAFFAASAHCLAG